MWRGVLQCHSQNKAIFVAALFLVFSATSAMYFWPSPKVLLLRQA